MSRAKKISTRLVYSRSGLARAGVWELKQAAHEWCIKFATFKADIERPRELTLAKLLQFRYDVSGDYEIVVGFEVKQ